MYSIANNLKNHRLYEGFHLIKGRLQAHQFVCWVAGGAVRDFCLQRPVHEFDLVTDATTDVLKILFPEAVLVGESFGVLKIPVLIGQKTEVFDLATFREEADYIDGRRPSAVLASTPTRDSVRRDLTVNALYWDDVFDVIRDYQGGLFDLEIRSLRAVGSADIRFDEDHLRIVRLARFALQLDFKMDQESENSALARVNKLSRISGERIWAELKKVEQSKAWPQASGQALMVSLLESLFGPPDIEGIKKVECMQGQQLAWFTFLKWLYPIQDLSDVLKNRLKISKQEMTLYKDTLELVRDFKTQPEEEVFYRVEKSADLEKVMLELVKSNLIEPELDLRYQKLKNTYPNLLLSGADLIQILAPSLVGDVLLEVRLRQWRGELKTRPEAINFVKKKYAVQSEKP